MRRGEGDVRDLDDIVGATCRRGQCDDQDVETDSEQLTAVPHDRSLSGRRRCHSRKGDEGEGSEGVAENHCAVNLEEKAELRYEESVTGLFIHKGDQ